MLFRFPDRLVWSFCRVFARIPPHAWMMNESGEMSYQDILILV